MLSRLTYCCFWLLARLPLSILHRLGAGLGWLIYHSSPRYARRLRDNLQTAVQCHPQLQMTPLLPQAVAEAGKSLLELAWIWLRPMPQLQQKIKQFNGLHWVEQAQQQGRGIIFLTPHLGCFEIAALVMAQRQPITVLYRKPRLRWLEPVMLHGRNRGNTTLAPADLHGVRTLFKKLKQRQIIGLLPDQVPGNGEGVWAPFFGRPAYTMTLVSKLAQKTQAQILLSYSERLPGGKGYNIHIRPLQLNPDDDPEGQLNQALEQLILQCPAQYLWSYNRYKTPRHAQPPTE